MTWSSRRPLTSDEAERLRSLQHESSGVHGTQRLSDPRQIATRALNELCSNLRDDGVTLASIAAALGRSVAAVDNRVRRHRDGDPNLTRPNRSLTLGWFR